MRTNKVAQLEFDTREIEITEWKQTCETCLGMTRNSVRVRRSSEMMSIAADSHACYIHIMTLTVLYSHYFFPFRSFLLEFIIKLITRFIISHQKVATICFQWAEC